MTSTSIKMVQPLYQPGGEGSPTNPVKFKGQDYKQLKEGLLKTGKKFEDETFPANLNSVGKLEGYTDEELRQVEWLRPHEINPEPSFVVDGISRFDFQQGSVGNCWFLSSIGALTLRKPLMVQVVPLGQSFSDKYAGIFYFRFWRFGKCVEVVIDDLLPTLYKQLVSVSSKSGKEFWASLMEKAYAKVCGSYGDMIAGNPPEAFKDFSGGVHMTYKLSKSPSDLWDVMNRAGQGKTMMGCGTYTKEKGREYFDKFGLVEGHAFAVSGFKQIESQGKNVNLVRIWNPWGETEWNGEWSDKSELWKTVSPEVREECLKVRDDGDFWMKMEDFSVYFEDLNICCDSPNYLDGDAACQWNCLMKEGRWEVGKSAGGCEHETGGEFWTNPQYRLTLKENKGDKNVLLSLMQKHDGEYRSKVQYHDIGLIIYKVPAKAPKGHLPFSLFQDKVVAESLFCRVREVIELHSFKPGEYVVIPCTFEPNKTASFIITVYSKGEAKLE